MRSKLGESESACFPGDQEAHGYEALQSMLNGEYTEESTGARTIRQSSGKDRHSKVFTSRGPRDRRVRLSVATAIRFYDLQDRLGFEQPSKAVEWLLLHCQPSIKVLPQLKSLHPHVHISALRAQPAHKYISDYASSDIPTMDGLTSRHEDIAHYNNVTLNHHDHQYREHREHRMHSYKKDSCQGTNHPLYAAHKQDSSVAEDPPEFFINPASNSGGSSDRHPTSLYTVSQLDSFEIKKYSHKAMPMFPYHSTSDPGLLRQHDQSYSTSSSFSCPSKRRRMESHPACFSINNHIVAPEKRSSFKENGNASGKGGCRLAYQQHAENLMQSAENIVSANYSDCSDVISTNPVEIYETPLINTSLISDNAFNTSTSSISNCNLLNMVNNSQPMQVILPSSIQQTQYMIGVMQSQRQLGAEMVSDVAANETLMSFQDVVGADALSTLSANANDAVAMQLYGEMAAYTGTEMATTATAYRNNSMGISPSESNSINNNIAGAYSYWQRK